MRALTYILTGIFLVTASCAGANKSLRKGKNTPAATTAAVAVKEEISSAPIREVEEKLVPMDQKAPDQHRYFVIIGSFMNPDNAKKHQDQISKDGFSSQILKNEAGLFRVSVMETDDVTEARNEIRRIWAKFPRYSDTWLLIQKNTH